MSKVTLESVAAEFRSGNSVPVERATLTRDRMQEVLEAYADAKVREALEEAANVCDSSAAKHASMLMKYETYSLESIHFQAVLEEAEELADDIRALLPPLPGPVEP